MADETGARITAAARTICEVGGTTLGPIGATKLLVEKDGSVTMTSAGSVVLDHLSLSDPAVTLLRSAADGFHEEHGDGTSRLLALVAALLAEADRLVDVGVHPATIERGYRNALSIALTHLDERTRPLSLVGLDAVSRSALTGVRNPNTREMIGEHLARITAELVDTTDAGVDFDPSTVTVRSRIGGSHAETQLVRGVVLDAAPAAENMPVTLTDAGVALLSETVDVPKLGSSTGRTQTNVSITPESFEDYAAVDEFERTEFGRRLDAALDVGCRFIATSRAVNERVKTTLANRGVLAVQRVDEDDLARISRATGARIVPGLDHVSKETLGTANVGVRRYAGRDMTSVESDAGEPVYTLFCRAPDPRSAETFRRSVESALAAATCAERSGRVVPGGGAIEMSCSHAVRSRARAESGREQLAFEAFADALCTVPRTLATNAGMDGWRAIIRLHVAHSEGRDSTGIDALTGVTADVLGDDPAADPAPLVGAIWSAATDLAVQLIRIDDRLPATDLGDDENETEDSLAAGR